MLSRADTRAGIALSRPAWLCSARPPASPRRPRRIQPVPYDYSYRTVAGAGRGGRAGRVVLRYGTSYVIWYGTVSFTFSTSYSCGYYIPIRVLFVPLLYSYPYSLHKFDGYFIAPYDTAVTPASIAYCTVLVPDFVILEPLEAETPDYEYSHHHQGLGSLMKSARPP